jgi:guanylate kinase
MKEGKTGKFFVIVGPSASGKTELVKELIKRIPNSARLVTTTTRVRRPEELATDYFFINRQEFEKGIVDGDFFEYAEVYGNLYGPSKKVLADFLSKYDYVFAIIDVQGAVTLKEKMKDARVIFIHPGSVEQIKNRLKRVRRGISEEELQKRLHQVSHELSMAPAFEHIVQNPEGCFDEAVQGVMSIVLGS